jgi:hypothetical protein
VKEGGRKRKKGRKEGGREMDGRKEGIEGMKGTFTGILHGIGVGGHSAEDTPDLSKYSSTK